MSDMNTKSTGLILNGKEYGLRFTVNAIDDIQEHFDIAIGELGTLFEDPKKQMKSIRYLLTVLINEGIDCKNDETGEKTPHVDERFVGRQINMSNISEVRSAIFGSFNSKLSEEEDEEDPNLKSEQ